eukprot:TRINITY_DN14981_c0_g1_i3.p2 TRINITY_DN14981_c0_g1~~TRINITY_DN14981_c0_g1_i3.p2  ORF type:complete len:187 (+),score=19.62 TRINITY_DN14981_c0_g1_i3:89-649(+)
MHGNAAWLRIAAVTAVGITAVWVWQPGRPRTAAPAGPLAGAGAKPAVPKGGAPPPPPAAPSSGPRPPTPARGSKPAGQVGAPAQVTEAQAVQVIMQKAQVSEYAARHSVAQYGLNMCCDRHVRALRDLYALQQMQSMRDRQRANIQDTVRNGGVPPALASGWFEKLDRDYERDLARFLPRGLPSPA